MSNISKLAASERKLLVGLLNFMLYAVLVWGNAQVITLSIIRIVTMPIERFGRVGWFDCGDSSSIYLN